MLKITKVWGQPFCSMCARLSSSLFKVTTSKKEEVIPRITVPARIHKKILRIKGKQAAKKHQAQRKYKGPLIISGKRPKFNHYKGQTYTDFNPQHLSSGGWKHRRSKGDHFTINAIHGNPALEVPPELSSFESLGIDDVLVKQLENHNIKQPTVVQSLAIPLLLKKRNIICAAETGSGKTLAYLLPMLQSISQQKQALGPLGYNTPRGLIIVPARELADQIYAVAQDLCDCVALKPKLLVGGRGTQHLLRLRPKEQTDLLVTTPGILSRMLNQRLYRVSQVSHVVFDEADTLLDDSFSERILKIISWIKVSSERLEVSPDDPAGEYEVGGTQVAFVSATMPRSISDILGEMIPIETLEKVTTPHLHKIMPHVSQKFVRLPVQDKPAELVKHLKRSLAKGISTMVFAGKADTARFVHYTLQENDIPNTLFLGDMSEKTRHESLEKFLTEETKVLVCTDLASRGLDTINAQHVINYDFPDVISDYIHRVGRVGRVGSPGAGFALSFVSKKWEVDTLWKIETAVRRSTEFHNVNANIKRKLVGNYEKKQMMESGEFDNLGLGPS